MASGDAGGGHRYPDDAEEELTPLDPGWPEWQKRRTMREMRANGWSDEGLARVFKMTPAAVEYSLRLGRCGVCQVPHIKCSRQDWRAS